MLSSMRETLFSTIYIPITLFLLYWIEKATWATRINEDQEKKQMHFQCFVLGLTKEFNKLNFPINAIENLISFLIYDFTRLEL